jgi:hypothetical protein
MRAATALAETLGEGDRRSLGLVPCSGQPLTGVNKAMKGYLKEKQRRLDIGALPFRS